MRGKSLVFTPPCTLVRYWANGRGEPVTFWSSADFALVAGGINSFVDSTNDTHYLLMGWGNVDIDDMIDLKSGQSRKYNIPQIPEFPAGKATWHSGPYTRKLAAHRSTLKEWIKFATMNGNTRKLIKTPGKQGQFARKSSRWAELMGDETTATASNGWVQTYEKLLKFEGDTFIDHCAEDFFKLLKLETAEGRVAARKSLEDSMPPRLAKAHEQLDRAVNDCYRKDSFPAGLHRYAARRVRSCPNRLHAFGGFRRLNSL